MSIRPIGPARTALDAAYPSNPTGVYVPAGWGQFWKPKRNAAASGQALIAVAGDSISLGLWSSSILTKGYIGTCRTALQSAYGDGGSGFFSARRSTVDTLTSAAGYAQTTEFVTASAGWATFGSLGGPSGGGLFSTASSGSAQTLTFTVRGNTVQLFYITNPGNGSFSWTVDGVSQGTVSTNAASNATVVSATGFGSGSHTVVVTVAAGQAAVYIHGPRATNATGIILDNYSIEGSTAASYAGTSFGGVPVWTGGANNPCDLLIYAFGVNDAHAGVAVDTYINSVTTFLRTVREGTGTAPKNGKTDILIVAPHIGQYDNATPVYHNYVTRLRALAEGYGAAFVNAWALQQNSFSSATAVGYWGSGTSSGAAGADTIHPSDAGHALIAAQVLSILTAA